MLMFQQSISLVENLDIYASQFWYSHGLPKITIQLINSDTAMSNVHICVKKKKKKKKKKLILVLKRHPITSNVISSLDVMTTNVTKEKFQYLAFAFISDHFQKYIKK